MEQLQKISLDTVIAQNQGIFVSEMDGEIVMMSIQNGKYYNLGAVGSVIWDLTRSPVAVGELIHSLLEQFDVGHDECEAQVLSFLDHLYQEGLILVE